VSDEISIARIRVNELQSNFEAERARIDEAAAAKQREARAVEIEAAYNSFLQPLDDLIAALHSGNIHETEQGAVLLEKTRADLRLAVPEIISLVRKDLRPALRVVSKAG